MCLVVQDKPVRQEQFSQLCWLSWWWVMIHLKYHCLAVKEWQWCHQPTSPISISRLWKHTLSLLNKSNVIYLHLDLSATNTMVSLNLMYTKDTFGQGKTLQWHKKHSSTSLRYQDDHCCWLNSSNLIPPLSTYVIYLLAGTRDNR